MASIKAHLYANKEDKGIQQGHIVACALHDGLLLTQRNAASQGAQKGAAGVACPQVALHLVPAVFTTYCMSQPFCLLTLSDRDHKQACKEI